MTNPVLLPPDPRKEIRKFGLIALVFFGALFGLAVWRERTVPSAVFGALGILGVLFLVLPGPMRPVYSGWLKAANAVANLITAIIFTLAYILVITPSAWLKRIFGGRPIRSRPDPGASTYWVEREEPVQPKERFHKRF